MSYIVSFIIMYFDLKIGSILFLCLLVYDFILFCFYRAEGRKDRNNDKVTGDIGGPVSVITRIFRGSA